MNGDAAVYLFDLASHHMAWLSERQALTAANIANADTPGYRTQGIGPFSSYLEGPSISLAATSPLHLTMSPDVTSGAERRASSSWASAHSGNNVSIEQELMTASSASRQMNIDAGVARSFQRMLLASVKA